MFCYNCKSSCKSDFSKQIKFCECGCKYQYHYNLEKYEENCENSIKLFYKDINNIEKGYNESKNLAKSFGVVWLPIGIQPSEVDRFLKKFSNDNETRDYLFKKSAARCVYINLQLPNQDRNSAEMICVSSSAIRDKIDEFINFRKKNIMNVGRIDHLDIPEGQPCADCGDTINFGEICVQTPHSTFKQNKSNRLSIGLKKKSKSSVDHLNSNINWHPTCFKCIDCKEVLLDFVYCWDDSSDVNIKGPLCLRHYNDRNYPRCQVCDEMIFDENSVLINENEYYHSDHLTCSACNIQIKLETDEVNNKEAALFACDGSICNHDHDSTRLNRKVKCINCLFGSGHSICKICDEPVTELEMRQVTDIRIKLGQYTVNEALLKVHKVCNNCHSCNKPFDVQNDKQSTNHHRYRNGYTVCENCQCGSQVRFYCRRCNNDVDLDSDSVLRTGQFVWHKACFNCALCTKELVVTDFTNDKFGVLKKRGEEFLSVSRLNIEDPCLNDYIPEKKDIGTQELAPICEKCFNGKLTDVCTLCFKKIDGEGVKYGNRLFHRDCFRCRKCRSVLTDDRFVALYNKIDENDDTSDPYCFRCGTEMFAKKCFKCHAYITDSSTDQNQLLMFEGKYWHDKCFNCSKCSIDLQDVGFLFNNDRLFCVACE